MEGKVRLGARPLLCPLPCVLASSGEADGRRGFAAAAWTGVVNSEPPMVYVALRPSRHTFGLVRETGAFGLNVPPAGLVEKVMAAGSVSGRDGDKFERLGLTAFRGEATGTALVAECLLNLECRVVREVELPTHTVFIGEVLECYADARAAEGGLPAAGELLSWGGGEFLVARALATGK